jgi:hypothetical protein
MALHVLLVVVHEEFIFIFRMPMKLVTFRKGVLENGIARQERRCRFGLYPGKEPVISTLLVLIEKHKNNKRYN